MGGLFGGAPKPPPIPAPEKAPPAPNRSASEIQEASAQQRARFRGSQGGRANTLLTGGLGTTGSSSATKRLLGA